MGLPSVPRFGRRGQSKIGGDDDDPPPGAPGAPGGAPGYPGAAGGTPGGPPTPDGPGAICCGGWPGTPEGTPSGALITPGTGPSGPETGPIDGVRPGIPKGVRWAETAEEAVDWGTGGREEDMELTGGAKRFSMSYSLLKRE